VSISYSGREFRRNVATVVPTNSYLVYWTEDPVTPHADKTCTKAVRRNQCRFSPDFVQLVLVLDHFCPIAQLFPLLLRATLQRKLKYEIGPTIVHAERLPAAASKNVPRVAISPAGSTNACRSTAISISFPRGPANS